MSGFEHDAPERTQAVPDELPEGTRTEEALETIAGVLIEMRQEPPVAGGSIAEVVEHLGKIAEELHEIRGLLKTAVRWGLPRADHD